MDKAIYYVISYNRATDDYRAEPRRGHYSDFHFRLEPDPRQDPVAEDAPAFDGGIYGRWPGQAVGHLRRTVNARVLVYLKKAHPVTGEPQYMGIG